MAIVIARMLDEPVLRVFDYSKPYSLDEAKRLAFADSLGQCDYIFAQTAVHSHTSEDDLRARYGTRVVTIANFYFRGLFPDSCYVGAFGERLDDPTIVNSIVVLDAFRRGLSVTEAVRSFNIDTFARLRLLDAWDSSMDELRRREANGVVDVPAAGLVEEACRSYPAFLTMNHPGAALLTDYMARVFRHVGIRHDFINPLSVADPLAVHDTTPVLDFVAEHLGLGFRTTQCWKINSLRGRYVGLEELVAGFYAAYAAAAPEKLALHSPSDLVDTYRADPDLRYLLDGAEALPEIARRAGHGYVAPAAPPHMLRAELQRLLRPVAEAADDIRVHTHKVHSFAEIADPKIERLVQALHKLDRLESEVQACHAGIASIARALPRDSARPRPRLRQRILNRMGLAGFWK